MNVKKFRTFAILFVVLLVLGFVVEAVMLQGDLPSTEEIFILVVQNLVSIFAVIYLLTGCRKGEGTKVFRWFMIAFAALALVSMVQANTMSIPAVILLTVLFGAVSVLASVKDLGREYSMFFAWLSVGCSACQFIVAALAGKLDVSAALKFGSLLVLSFVTVLMVAAKYADKAARGSK